MKKNEEGLIELKAAFFPILIGEEFHKFRKEYQKRIENVDKILIDTEGDKYMRDALLIKFLVESIYEILKRTDKHREIIEFIYSRLSKDSVTPISYDFEFEKFILKIFDENKNSR